MATKRNPVLFAILILASGMFYGGGENGDENGNGGQTTFRA